MKPHGEQEFGLSSQAHMEPAEETSLQDRDEQVLI